MKKIFTTLAILTILQVICFGQTNIQIKYNGQSTFDSLKVQTCDNDMNFQSVYELKFKKETSIVSKTSLAPGVYWIFGDSTMCGAFLISSAKGQTFSIEINDEDVFYSGSPENSNYKEYLQGIQQFDQQMQGLDQEYQNAKSRLPQYMLAPLVDTLNAKALRIAAAKADYQRQIVKNNPNTLLASIVQCSIDIPQPSKEISSNRALMMEYYVSHYFDNFPWNDPTIFKTPIGINKVKEFCSLIAQAKRPEFDDYVMAAIQLSKVDTGSYFAFFDKVEKTLGDHASPYRIERLYIKMLKDMLTLPKLPADRKRHCTYELSVIDKNHEGDLAPNFNIVTSKGEKMSLYDIQSEYLLLYLQHPTCPTCQRVRQMIADFPILNNAIASGKLKVLTVYFEDDQQIWNDYIVSPEANPKYMHGWNKDQSIEEKKLYDTRAIPYMFILDKDKRIIKKNVMETELEDAIRLLHINN